ncbi:IS3 family transposase (plasmid) [Cupriavidus pinatubonensis]|nr:IS3 family transposase [Cupriavidus pinatubonensis]QYY34169.1 IS3 family transposase [Cupriavidus pinatubonensis]
MSSPFSEQKKRSTTALSHCRDLAQAQGDIIDYVLFFYNRQRLHSATMNI